MMFLILIAFGGIISYFSIFNYGFSQDDFIHLSAVSINNFSQFLNFFNPWATHPDIFHFRPLTTFLYFFVNNQLFGLNALPFRIEALALHLVNGFLFYLIIKEIWRDRKIAIISGLFYTVSAIHFLSLFYISAFQQIGAAFFIFLSIYLFFKNRYLLSHIAFIAALLSKETSIILPVLIFLLEFLKQRERPKIKIFIPYFVIAAIYLTIRLVGIQTTLSQGEYSLSLTPAQALENLKWYFLWSFGLPEIISTYPSLKSFIPQFIKDFNLGVWIALSWIVFLISTLLLFKRSYLDLKNITVSGAVFILTLLPVLFLKDHKYPQYLDLAYLVFIPFFVRLYNGKGFRQILTIVAIISYMSLQILSIRLSESTHWTTHRSLVAQFYHQELEKKDLPAGATVVFTGTYDQIRELSNALAGKYAPKVWFPGKINEVKYLPTEGLTRFDERTIVQDITVF